MARLSTYSKLRKKGKFAWEPDLSKWKKVCGMCAFDTQIFRTFQISRECFYAFLDRERFKEEQDPEYRSAYLVYYVNERFKTKDRILNAFLDKIDDGDTASVIFGMKVFNGAIEAKDMVSIEFKRHELMLKTKDFLFNLADKFNLDFEQVKGFAKTYFKEIDDIQN